LNAKKLNNYPKEYFDFIRKYDLKKNSLVHHLANEKYSWSIGTKFRKELGMYAELHHILPIFDGGKKETSNFVILTPHHHLIAHLILAEKLGGRHWHAAKAVTEGNIEVNSYRNEDTSYQTLVKSYENRIKQKININKEKKYVTPNRYSNLIGGGPLHHIRNLDT